MNLKKVKLVHETPNHFILHDGNTHFHVAKKGLNEEMVKKIQGFWEGQIVKEYDPPLSRKEEMSYNLKEDAKSLENSEKELREIVKQRHLQQQYEGTPNIPAPKKPKPLAQEVTDFFERMKTPPEKKSDGGVVGFDQDFAEKFKKGSGFSDGSPSIPTNIDPVKAKQIQDSFRKATGFSHGGEIDHNIDPKLMEAEAQRLNTPLEYMPPYVVQKFDAGTTAVGLPPNFDERVLQEQQKMAIDQTAMPPQTIDNSNILPPTAQPLPVEQFKTQAETSVAAQDQEQLAKAASNEEQEKARTAQAVQEENSRIQADNQVRAQAGLPLIPTTALPAASTQAAQMVSPENQVSFSPQRSISGSPMPQADLVSGFDKSMKSIESGIKNNAKLQAQMLAENAKNTQAYLDDMKQRNEAFQIERAKLQQQNDELYNQVKDSKVDPDRYWNNSSTGQKIAASLGLIFGGIGAGMTHSANTAADFIQKTIDRDIESQKSDQSNKLNMYKLGLEKYKDAQSAEQFAQLQAANILAGQIQATAQRIGSPQALELAKQSIGELHMKYDPIRNDLALKQTAMNYSQQPQQQLAPASGINTAKMNAFMNAGLYDPETKKELIKEQGEYIKAKNFLDLTDNLFNEQSKNANYTNRGILKHLPTARESTKQYDAAVNAYLDKMTKDLTGRVTPQSMENLQDSMPVAGDSPETLLAKRNAMKDIIRSAYDFPNLMNKGLVNPKDPVLQSQSNINTKFQQGPPVIKK